MVFILFSVFVHHQNNKKAEELRSAVTQMKTERVAVLEKLESDHIAVETVKSQFLPGIVCWGDSLTAGAGGNGTTYPKVLEALIVEKITSLYDPARNLESQYKYLAKSDDFSISIPVYNMGVGGETTNTILGRNGAVPFVLSSAVSIPSDETAVQIGLISKNGSGVAPLIQGKAGMDYVEISGVRGVISYNKDNKSYYFTRETAGNAVSAPAGTEVITQGSQNYRDLVTVIFMGTNDYNITSYQLIEKINAMLAHQTSNKNRFIIVGLHAIDYAGADINSRLALEAGLKAAYGDKFINLREYMAESGMKDAELTPTETDLQMMAEGSTPKSLLSDEVHFNATGYTLLGNLVYERMDELGYFKEIKSAMGLK